MGATFLFIMPILILTLVVFLVSQSSATDAQLHDFNINLPIRSKILSVQIEDEDSVLSRSIENKERRVVGAFAKLKSGVKIESPQEIVLQYPDSSDRALVDEAQSVIRAKLKNSVQLSGNEEMKFKIISFRKDLKDDQKVQIVLLVAYPPASDVARVEEVLKEARARDDIEVLEAYDRFENRGEAVGFAVISDRSVSKRLFQVRGTSNRDLLELQSSKTVLKVPTQFDQFLEAVLDWRFKKSTEAEVRTKYVLNADALRSASLSFQAELSETQRILIPTADDKFSHSLALNLGRSIEVQDYISSIEIHRWENSDKLDSDRQQVQAIAIRPIFGSQKDYSRVASVIVSYDPNFPADSFDCVPHVLRTTMHGSLLHDGSAFFSELFGSEKVDEPWTLSFAHLKKENSETSKISSWTFFPSQPERLKTQPISSGLKVFVNSISKTSEVTEALIQR